MKQTNKQATTFADTEEGKQESQQKKNTYSKPELTFLGTTKDIKGTRDVGADGGYS